MATRRFAPKARRGRVLSSTGHAYGVPVPDALHDAIEAERGNLSKAESLLGCLVVSMEYQPESVDGPHYPDVAQLARQIVRQSINGLDSLVLQQHMMKNRVKEVLALPCIHGAYPPELPGCPVFI